MRGLPRIESITPKFELLKVNGREAETATFLTSQKRPFSGHLKRGNIRVINDRILLPNSFWRNIFQQNRNKFKNSNSI